MAKRAIANLAVSVTARTKDFVKGISRARKATRRLTKTFGKLTRAAGTLAGIGGVGGLGLVVKSSLDTIDALAKTSDKLGVTVEALQGLHHAARLSGVEVRTFNMGLQRMTRRVAEAGKGTGEAKAAIAELGLSAARLAAMSPDQQFLAIADAMEKVTTQGDRVRLGFKLFDSEGVALINTLRGGSAALESAQRAMELLGIVTTEESKAVEEAVDALNNMKTSLTDVANAITTAAAPGIKSLAEGITDLVAGLKNMDKGTAGELTTSGKWLAAGAAVALFSKKLWGVVLAAKSLMLLGGPAGWLARFAVATVGVLGNEQVTRAKYIATNAKEWGAHLRKVAEQQANITRDVKAAAEDTDGAAEGARRLAQETERTATALAEIEKRTARLKRFAEGVKEQTQLPIERQREQVGKLLEARRTGDITAEQLSRGLFQASMKRADAMRDPSANDIAFREIAGTILGGRGMARNAELEELKRIGQGIHRIRMMLAGMP